MPPIPKERIYMFRGDEGNNQRETTTDEINSFIVQNLKSQKATNQKVFSYPDYLISAKNSRNEDMRAAAD